jgi:environmental stress-induced protein Ves
MGWAACFRRLGMVAAGLNLRRAADRAPTGAKPCITPGVGARVALFPPDRYTVDHTRDIERSVITGMPCMINNTPLGTRIAHAAQPPGTWAGGTTRAIYAYPSESIGTPATAQLWVGTAVIDRVAAYSFFPERTRIHVPIHGNGIRLHFQNPAEVVALGSFAQHRFDGARPVQVELIDGAIIAFNLIVHADVAAEIDVLHIGSQNLALELDRIPAAHTTRAASVVQIVYAVTGTVALMLAAQSAITLHPADAFVFHSRAVAQPLGMNVGLRGLAAQAEVVVATLVFGSDP